MSHEEALGFAHILLIVLVFALEIPVLVVEASAEDRIRHLLHKRLTHRAITALMVTTLVVVIVLIFLAGTVESRQASRQAVLTDVTGHRQSASAIQQEQRSPATKKREGVSLRTTARPIVASWSNIDSAALARGLSVMMLVFFGILWVYMMKSDVRTRLVHEIKRTLIRSFKNSSSFNVQDVEDLVTLGENSSPGHEKLVVLDAVAAVCEAVQVSDRYDGNELFTLIHGLQRIVAIHERRPADEDVLKAIRVLGACWIRFEESPRPRHPDRDALIETACSIGEMAVEHYPDPVARACLDAVPTVESVPFRIGMAALRHDRFFVAVAALTRLRALTGNNAPSSELIALFAHFCAKGPSATQTAVKLHHTWELGELTAAINAAAKLYYTRCDFITADVIRHYLSIVTERSTPATAFQVS
jgi:hypothetical protein